MFYFFSVCPHSLLSMCDNMAQLPITSFFIPTHAAEETAILRTLSTTPSLYKGLDGKNEGEKAEVLAVRFLILLCAKAKEHDGISKILEKTFQLQAGDLRRRRRLRGASPLARVPLLETRPRWSRTT